MRSRKVVPKKRTRRKPVRRKAISFSGGKPKRFDGVAVKQDGKGYYVTTHRARSKSYPTASKIPVSAIRFIRSTG